MKKEVVDRLHTCYPRAYREKITASQKNTVSFYDSLRQKKDNFPVNLIAELKRKSPSRGDIRPDADVGAIVRNYNCYASAISVLTDPSFFGGSPQDLQTVRTLTNLPLLRKDFLLEPIQIIEARFLGAAAALVIAAFADGPQIEEMISAASDYSMDVLMEIHNRPDFDKIHPFIQSGKINVLGINNRNLHTLQIDLSTTNQLLEEIYKVIPDTVVVVSESGIHRKEDILSLSPRVDAVLVGSSIMESENPGEKISQMGFIRKENCP